VSDESERRYDERYLSALSNILSGGLLVNTKDGADLPPERALMRVAGALLKAVNIAKFGDEQIQEEVGWCMDSTRMSDDETQEALSGIIALLRDAPVVLEKLRMENDFRESHERIEHLEWLGDQQVTAKGELANPRTGEAVRT
jgi:hypothetical protein